MKLIDTNWDPTHRQLRQFGVICLCALPLVGWFWFGMHEIVGWLAFFGLSIAISGLVYPPLVKPIFIGAMLVATPIGIVIGEIVLLLTFFGLFLPIGLLFRLLKRDALQMQIDRRAKTYWQAKQQPRNAASYYRQS